MAGKTTHLQRLKGRIENSQALAWIIVVTVFIGGLASLVQAVENLGSSARAILVADKQVAAEFDSRTFEDLLSLGTLVDEARADLREAPTIELQRDALTPHVRSMELALSALRRRNAARTLNTAMQAQLRTLTEVLADLDADRRSTEDYGRAYFDEFLKVMDQAIDIVVSQEKARDSARSL
jgi:Pyruvate/2-oxoacid:ferredoxin oxidoreductase gamma subunit